MFASNSTNYDVNKIGKGHHQSLLQSMQLFISCFYTSKYSFLTLVLCKVKILMRKRNFNKVCKGELICIEEGISIS
jgi:hypothetical protein